ncbi:MAG: LapA family protein [Gammaproteobacteria bacterium]|nr:LapA family protein [Gammaproteobacteria bacterium]
MRILSYIVAIILVIFGLTFALLNASPVQLNYYIGTTSLSLSLLLILTVGLGIVIGLIACIGPILKQKRKNYHLRQRVKQLEQQIVIDRLPEKKDRVE